MSAGWYVKILIFRKKNFQTRERMVQPVRGMAYSITLIVQFHDTFVTAADKAFQVRCFYRERTVDVNANTLDVR